LEARPANVHVVSRLRLDAALWTSPPPRRQGQKGRPRKRGRRLPTPKVVAAQCRRWRTVPVTLYGRAVRVQYVPYTALWYQALRDQPVQIVLVRDPSGQRKDEAFFCTDPSVSVAFLLEGYARRWTLEVTFFESKQFLGFEDAQNQAKAAVERTAPLAFVVYDLVLLWYAARPTPTEPAWVVRPWYRHKATASFLDMLTALRREGWARYVSAAPGATPRGQNAGTPWPDAVFATA
jgi:hypothetical protein